MPNLKHLLTFFIITLITLSFLIFQDGFWLYVDSAWYPTSLERYKQHIIFSLNSFSNVTYFWYDSSALLWTRLLQTSFKILPQSLYYFIFFLCSFFSAFYLLKIFFKNNASFYWALFFTFNPVSIYLLQQVGYLYSYFSLNLVLLGIYFYLKSWKFFSLLLFALWVLLFPAYGRILWIYGTFLLLLWLFYRKEIFSALKTKKIRSYILIGTALGVSLPFFISFIYPYFSWEKEYFVWMTNFVSQAEWWWKSLYRNNQSLPFIQAFYPQEIQQNFSGAWNKTFIYKGFSILFFIWIIFSFLLIQIKQTGKKLWIYLFWVLLVSILIIAGWKFFSQELFHAIVYNYYPFIVNNTRWMFLLLVPIYAFILSYLYTKSIWKQKNVIKISLIVYILIVIFPLIPISQNVKTKLVNIAPNYYNLLQTKDETLGSSIILPQTTLFLEWNPYHIKLNNNVNYKNTFHNNSRSVTSKQISLWKNLNAFNETDLNTHAIFNLKNILVFKNIINTSNKTFNWYSWEWLKEKSNKYLEWLKDNNFYKLEKETPEYSVFWDKYNNSYEFFIYSPKTIIENIKPKSLSSTTLSILNRPILIDSTAFNKPDKVEWFELAEENRNIRIDYKRSNKNSTKYYLKISNVDTTKDFLVQLNQTFWVNWKLKWINENDFKQHSCIENYQYFSITNNSFCYINDHYYESLNDYKYLKNKSVKEDNHFEGNFIWNSWLIETDDLREEDKWKNELYAIIIYEKQLWYIWSILITFSVLSLIALSSITQFCFYKWKRQKKSLAKT